MRVLIEEYRKWEIFFDTNSEDFYTVSNEYDNDKTKRSYAAVKKYIDDYIKDNETFTPVSIQREDGRVFKLIGIRKDGAFMYEDKDGRKQQFSKCDESRYFLVDSANDHLFEKLETLRAKRT